MPKSVTTTILWNPTLANGILHSSLYCGFVNVMSTIDLVVGVEVSARCWKNILPSPFLDQR